MLRSVACLISYLKGSSKRSTPDHPRERSFRGVASSAGRLEAAGDGQIKRGRYAKSPYKEERNQTGI